MHVTDDTTASSSHLAFSASSVGLPGEWGMPTLAHPSDSSITRTNSGGNRRAIVAALSRADARGVPPPVGSEVRHRRARDRLRVTGSPIAASCPRATMMQTLLRSR